MSNKKTQLNPFLPAVPKSSKKNGLMKIVLGVPLAMMGTQALASPLPAKTLEVPAQEAKTEMTQDTYKKTVLVAQANAAGAKDTKKTGNKAGTPAKGK